MKNKVKARIATAIMMLIAKVSDYINQNETRRISVGLGLSIGSFLYTFFLVDISESDGARAFLLCVVTGVLCILGLVILTRSMDLVTKMVTKFSMELAGLCVFGMSCLIIAQNMTVPYSAMTGVRPILLLASVLVFTFYLARVSMFIYLLLKKAYTQAVGKLKGAGEKIKSKTEIFDSVLKNLLSIAGTLAIILKFFEPVIKMIFGS